MKSLICKSICVLIGLLLVACGTNTPYRAPVVDIGQEVEPSARTTVILGQGPAHRVNEGETLYAIAWMYDLDFQELALANNIPSPYVIYPGQELSLDVSNIEAQLASAPARSPVATEPACCSRNTSPTGTSQTRAAGTSNALLRWVWPANAESSVIFLPQKMPTRELIFPALPVTRSMQRSPVKWSMPAVHCCAMVS